MSAAAVALTTVAVIQLSFSMLDFQQLKSYQLTVNALCMGVDILIDGISLVGSITASYPCMCS